MENMKVLFITCVYSPLKYPRSIQITHLVQYLQSFLSLTILTCNLNEPKDASLEKLASLNNIFFAKKTFLNKVVEKIRGYRLKKALMPDLYYFHAQGLYRSAQEMVKDNTFQTIVTFGQPMSTHLAGLRLKKKRSHLKWIAHFSDPWVDNPYNSYNFWLKFINGRFQDQVFKYADQLIFTSQETIKLVMKKYPELVVNKSQMLPHAFNPLLYKGELVKDKKFIIRYVGHFYGARQPTTFLEALDILNRKDAKALENVFIEFIGSSPIATSASGNLIKFIPSVDYITSLRLMKESDLLLVIDAPAEESVFLASKLIDYIGADRPIFGITPPGTSQKLIEELGFLTANPNNPEEIAENLLIMLQKIKQGTIKMKQNIRERYSVETIGNQMLQLLKDCEKSEQP